MQSSLFGQSRSECGSRSAVRFRRSRGCPARRAGTCPSCEVQIKSGSGAVMSHSVRHMPSTQRAAIAVGVRAAERRGSLRGRGSCAAGRSPPRRRLRSRRRSLRRTAASRFLRRSWSTGRGIRCCRRTPRRCGSHRLASHAVPLGHSVCGPQRSRHRLLAQVKPAAHWKSNWQVSAPRAQRSRDTVRRRRSRSSAKQVPRWLQDDSYRGSRIRSPTEQSRSARHSAMAGM